MRKSLASIARIDRPSPPRGYEVPLVALRVSVVRASGGLAGREHHRGRLRAVGPDLPRIPTIYVAKTLGLGPNGPVARRGGVGAARTYFYDVGSIRAELRL